MCQKEGKEENSVTSASRFLERMQSLHMRRAAGEHEASRRVKSELLVQIDGINSTQVCLSD